MVVFVGYIKLARAASGPTCLVHFSSFTNHQQVIASSHPTKHIQSFTEPTTGLVHSFTSKLFYLSRTLFCSNITSNSKLK